MFDYPTASQIFQVYDSEREAEYVLETLIWPEPLGSSIAAT